jgi:LacI family transcriptional regulator
MKRIAAELGVSITTISKVLNNHADIGPATRARVLARVEELGYRPNAVARSLTLRRTHTVGVIIPDLMHSFFVEIVAGLEAIAAERGYGVLICASGEDPKRERAALEMLRARQVDGIVLASATATSNTALLRDLVSHGAALVMIDRDDHPRVACHRVLTDDVKVGRLATEHLLSRARRSIAHLAGPPIAHAQRRVQGYREALAAARGRIRPPRVVQGGFMEADGYRAMTALLQSSRVDGVFAANDPSAIGAMRAIWDAGLRVPDDISVVGAGDVAYSDLIRVPLTTVRWSKRDLGQQAAALILDEMEATGKVRPRRVIIPPELVVRESS